MTSDKTEGPDDADLPGLDDVPAPAAESDGRPDEWSHAELDDWFENDFGGKHELSRFFRMDEGFSDTEGFRVTAASHPDLYFGMTAYEQLSYAKGFMPGEADPWRSMSLEAKIRFRRGWENSQTPAGSVADELAPYDAMTTLVDARHDLGSSRSALPRWIWIGGGIGLLGLVLAVGFFLLGGDGDQEDSTRAAVVTMAGTAPPITTAPITEASLVDETPAAVVTPDPTVVTTAVSVVDDTQAPAVAVGDSDAPPVVPFPTRWSYTATKTADIVPAPGFITPTPIGTELPWAFDVFETCGEACSYTTVIYPLIPEAVLDEVPETTWVVNGAEWSLDVTYQTVQSRNADGTVCAVANHDVFELTVAYSDVDGRSVPVSFTGSWIQATSLDLEASTGDTASYCGEAWEVVDEWAIEGFTAS